MDTFFKLTSYIKSNKNKERFETILEPLQAIIQLSLLSYCPVGTKLSISKNLLQLQSSNWNQSIIRSYNSDTRDDIFFLFSVIKRFNKFYDFLKKIPGYHSEFFEKLTNLSIRGLDKLLLTYSNTNHHQLLHTLNIYKLLLIKPNAFNESISDVESNSKKSISENTSTNTKISKNSTSMFNNYNEPDSKDDIDDIFIKITKIYTNDHYQLINNLFNILDNDQNNYDIYIEGINTILYPVNEEIKKWINENIIF